MAVTDRPEKENTMDIVFLAAAVVAAIFLPRPRALLVTVAVWAVCVSLVGWGPAHNAAVHTRSVGFWVPWGVVLVIGIALAYGITYVRQRRGSTDTGSA